MTAPRTTGDPDVVDNSDASRYELRSNGQLAGFAAYNQRDKEIVFTHTDVFPDFADRGLGSRLARSALDDVRSRDLLAVPCCPFIAAWIRTHPDYADLVDNRHRHLIER